MVAKERAINSDLVAEVNTLNKLTDRQDVRLAEGKPAEMECDKCCDGFITIICPDCDEEGE